MDRQESRRAWWGWAEAREEEECEWTEGGIPLYCDESDDEADAGKDGFGPSAPFASRRVKAAGSRGAERTADQSREGLRGFAACMAEDDGYEEAWAPSAVVELLL